MEPISSFTLAYDELLSLVDSLNDAIKVFNRADIIRACSNIQYCLADIVEYALPDGYIVDVKPLNK